MLDEFPWKCFWLKNYDVSIRFIEMKFNEFLNDTFYIVFIKYIFFNIMNLHKFLAIYNNLNIYSNYFVLSFNIQTKHRKTAHTLYETQHFI